MSYELIPRNLRKLASRSPFNLVPRLLENFEDPFELLKSTNFEDTGLELSEDEKHVYVTALVPGLTPNEIEITLERGILLIKGEKEETEKDEKRKYYRKAQRSFWYQVTLPASCDESHEPKATCKNGILELTLQKSHSSQAKKITIKGN